MDFIKSESSLKPIYSREMTLEAHFTFTSPTSSASTKMVSSESATRPNTTTPPSPPLVSMTPRMSSFKGGVGDSWQWGKDRAHCSVVCGHHGVQMQYSANPENRVLKEENNIGLVQTYRGSESASTSRMDSKSHEKHMNKTNTSSQTIPPCENSLMPLQHPSESASKGSRIRVARPYERRCKSTAHIVLQNNTKFEEQQRPREFHGSTYLEDLSKKVKYRNSKDHEQDIPSLQPIPHYHQPDYDYRHALSTSTCSCPHCTTLNSLMTSLRCEFPCRCPCQYHEAPQKNMIKFAQPLLQTFNSHRSYETPSLTRYCKRDSAHVMSATMPSTTRRIDTPVPSSQSPSPERTPTPRHKQFIRRDSYSMEKHQQEREAHRKKRTRKGRRPRTIHIDVYCSTSSSSDNDSEISCNSSNSTIGEETSQKKSSARTLVALGSKKNQYKNNFQLQSRSLEQVVGFNKNVSQPKTVSYESSPVEGKSHTGTFITDHPLSLCSSPSTPLERPVSSPPQVNVDRYNSEDAQSNILTDLLLPCPPKPRTLPISFVNTNRKTKPLDSKDYSQEYDLQEQDNHHYKLNQDFGSHSLGSLLLEDFENDTSSQLDANITGLNTAFSGLYTEEEKEKSYSSDDIFIRPWRSPELERHRYLTNLEENSSNLFQDKRVLPATDFNEPEPLKTPTEVFELAKLSVFKDFSEEELQVISKSLTRRESERSGMSRHSGTSLSRHSSFRYPKTSSLTSSRSSLHSPICKESFPVNANSRKNVSEEVRKFLKDLKQGNDKCSKALSQNNSWNSLPCRGKSRQIEVDYKSKHVAEDLSPPSKFSSKTENVTSNATSSSRRQSTGSRLINVGHIKKFDRFPFSTYTYPGPYQSHPTVTLSDDDRRFVRTNVFGETLKTSRRHGIHFGPPRNPQCSCVSCRVWRLNSNRSIDGNKEDSPPRPRTRSLSEISQRSSCSTSSVKKCS